MWSPKEVHIRWEDDFSYWTQWLFLALPWVLLAIIFVFRRKLAGLPNWAKTSTTITLGAYAILWELWFDVSQIMDSSKNTADAMWDQFVGGWDFCRMNTYIVGVLLILQRKEMIKWVAATALFGGYSTLINHYGAEADIHSLITHSVILCIFAAIGATMWGSNYKVRNLIHSHLFNWTLVAFMYFVVNEQWGGVAGELTKDRMDNNMMVGFAPFPLNMFLWILAVMFLEWMYFIVFRLIWWRTYQAKKSFGYTFAMEWKADKAEWYGFKLWGKNSFYKRSHAKTKNVIAKTKQIKK